MINEKIWIIGGTKDSRDFIEKIPQKNNIIVTVATEYGKEILEKNNSNLNDLKIIVGKLNKYDMENFIKMENIEKIVDLSHPYAKEVSRNAIELSEKMNIPYFRYERPSLESLERENVEKEDEIVFNSINEIVDYIEKLEENILVTLGSNSIVSFKKLKNLKNIYFRVLPDIEVLKKCKEANILPKNILALQGPFSFEMNVAMIKEYKIKYIISKYSGKIGGEEEKREAAKKTGIKILFLKKPEINYRNIYENIYELLIDIFE